MNIVIPVPKEDIARWGHRLQRRVAAGQFVSGLVQLRRMIVSRRLLAHILQMDCQ